MLKITIEESASTKTLRLEGRISGAWVNELRQAWQEQAKLVGEKRILVDLCGVTHVNADGIGILADMHRETGAEFLTRTPMTQYFAEEARRRGTQDRKIKISKES